jgi:hypothetical protein
MGFDQIGPLPVSESGNRYINLACDYFSKYGEAMAMKQNTAETCAQFAYENIICRFGMFDGFITDQGPQFESRLFKELCRLCGVKKFRTTSYHHETVGQVERLVKTLKEILRCYINESHTNYDLLLKQVMYAYNTTRHSSTGFTPYEVVFGRKPVSFQEIALNIQRNYVFNNKEDYLQKLFLNNQRIQKMVNHSLEKSRLYQKKQHDKLTDGYQPHKEGDLVLLKNESGKARCAKSLLPKFIGPFLILERINELNYKICWPNDTNNWKVVHYNRLKSYYTRKQSNDNVTCRSRNEKALTAVDDQERDKLDDYLYYLITIRAVPDEEITTDEQQASNSNSGDEVEADRAPISPNREDRTFCLENTVIIEMTGEDEEGEDEEGEKQENAGSNNSKVCPFCNKAYIYKKSFDKHVENCSKRL